MSIETLACKLIRCDTCGVPGPINVAIDAATAEALAVNWVIVHGVHQCPACSARSCLPDCADQVVSLADEGEVEPAVVT